jgi:hypothetical protein
MIRSITTLRIQANGLDSSIADSTSVLRAVAILTLTDFDEVSRIADPDHQARTTNSSDARRIV